MTLSIKKVHIEDALEQLAQTCRLELVSAEAQATGVAEFSFPGDQPHNTASAFRPDGTRLSVSLGAGADAYPVFSGIIDYMDDMTEPDKYEYNMDLSDVPNGEPQKVTFTKIYNMISVDNFKNDFQVTSSHNVLQDACAVVGLDFGRCDLPDYAMWGTFEVVRKNVVQVAEELCAPFNTFPHTQYKVRCDRNGLQIIKIDYTLGGEVANAHIVEGYLSVHRTFERYMPDNRLGNQDVLLQGAEIYGATADQQNGQNKTYKFIATKTYQSDSRNSFVYVENQPNLTGFDEWVISTTNMIFDVTAKKAAGDPSPFGDPLPILNKPVGSTDNQQGVIETNYSSDLDTLVGMLKTGAIADLNISGSYTLSEIKQTFSNDTGTNGNVVVGAGQTLERDSTTTSTYTIMSFADSSFVSNVVKRRVLTYSETVSRHYTQGVATPELMDRTYYNYNSLGVQTSTVVKHYIWDRDAWTLGNIDVQTASMEGSTNAEIQFYLNHPTYGDTIGGGPSNPQQLGVPPAPTELSPGGISVSVTQTQIGQYKMLNCKRLPTGVPLIDGPGINLGQPNSDIFSQVYDSNQQLKLENFAARIATHIECAHMDFSGMALICPLVDQQRYIEQNNGFWEIVTIIAGLDTIPYVGESTVIAGSSGIVEKVEHEIDGDSALTTVALKRLVIPQGQQSPLLGNYENLTNTIGIV